MLELNQPAPDFSGTSNNNETISLKDFKGKYLVIFFYPKDDTPGCTIESCEFRDLNSDFEEINTAIIGISPDAVESHQEFIEKFSLNFPLLADTDQKIQQAYDVPTLDKGYLERSTFLIAPDGTIAQIWRNVNVLGHVNDVLSTIEEHQELKS
ncbi:MAG: peroxiredoxin [Alphaproteobacteria bacterium]|nr:peroxiredoxin [Alphaproteobacteria bacterium]